MDPVDAGLVDWGEGSRVVGLQLSGSYYSDMDGTVAGVLEST